jgi:hypothetical protein
MSWEEVDLGWQIVMYLIAITIVWCLLAHCILTPCCTCLKRRNKVRIGALNEGPGFKFNCAHRGGSCETAENTTGAFKHALKQGLNMLECDVHLSKDGVVVVSHDETLDRMCSAEFNGKKVSDFNFKELPPFKRSFELHLMAGTYQLQDEEEGRFTTLRELFGIADGVFISIDLKETSNDLCEKVA